MKGNKSVRRFKDNRKVFHIHIQAPDRQAFFQALLSEVERIENTYGVMWDCVITREHDPDGDEEWKADLYGLDK